MLACTDELLTEDATQGDAITVLPASEVRDGTLDAVTLDWSCIERTCRDAFQSSGVVLHVGEDGERLILTARSALDDARRNASMSQLKVTWLTELGPHTEAFAFSEVSYALAPSSTFIDALTTYTSRPVVPPPDKIAGQEYALERDYLDRVWPVDANEEVAMLRLSARAIEHEPLRRSRIRLSTAPFYKDIYYHHSSVVDGRTPHECGALKQKANALFAKTPLNALAIKTKIAEVNSDWAHAVFTAPKIIPDGCALKTSAAEIDAADRGSGIFTSPDAPGKIVLIGLHTGVRCAAPKTIRSAPPGFFSDAEQRLAINILVINQAMCVCRTQVVRLDRQANDGHDHVFDWATTLMTTAVQIKG